MSSNARVLTEPDTANGTPDYLAWVFSAMSLALLAERNSTSSFALRRSGTQALQDDVEAFVELPFAVVCGELTGQRAQPREFAGRQPVEAQPQQVVSLVRVVHALLQLVEHVSVEETDVEPVGVQRAASVESGFDEQVQQASSGRNVPSGRMASGVASGRVTISGTTCGWARASARKACAARRSASSQSPLSGIAGTGSSASANSTTPSIRSSLLGAWRYSRIGSRPSDLPSRRMDSASTPSASTSANAALSTSARDSPVRRLTRRPTVVLSSAVPRSASPSTSLTSVLAIVCCPTIGRRSAC